MNRIASIHETLNFIPNWLRITPPFPDLEHCKDLIFSNPLLERVTANWKVILMDCSTIICITAFVVTFLTGSTLVCSAFAIAAIASGVSAFYMRKFSSLSDLQDTSNELRVSKERFEGIARTLEEENNRLSQSNLELQSSNETFRENNQNLIQTNDRLTQQVSQLSQQVNHLSTQVTQLTLQTTQLKECTDRIRSEVHRFQQENGHLHINLRVLDQQISNSRALCEQIVNHLSSHEIGLGEQLELLKRYLADLSADNRVHERIQPLATLQNQAQQAADQLQSIRLQYATELGNFQTIHQALVQLRNQFDEAIRNAAAGMHSNNAQLRANIEALAVERQRIHDLIDRYAPGGMN